MPLFIEHRDLTFEDDLVYCSGHAYFNCTFRRCTLLFKGGPGALVRCHMEACAYHFDLMINDKDGAKWLAQVASWLVSGMPDPTSVKVFDPAAEDIGVAQFTTLDPASDSSESGEGSER